MIFTPCQSKAGDPLPLNVVVAFPAEGFVGEDVEGNPAENAGENDDEIAAAFIREAEAPALVEAIATSVMEAVSPALVEVVAGMIGGCAVLMIPARLSVTLTLSQNCMAKVLTSERCQ